MNKENDKNKTFDEAYKQYFKYIYNYIYRRVGSIHDTEDVVEEAFMAAWKNWDSYDQELDLKKWLFGIALHKLNDYFRKKYKLTNSFSAEPIDNIAEKEISEVTDKASKYLLLLDELLIKLKPKEQLFIELRFKKSYKFTEVATELGITVNNAKVMQNRTLKKLKKLWEEYHEF